MAFLSKARYGKDKVRVFRVVKEGDVHEVVEYNVCVLLQGDIAAAWTDSDNSKIVATDSIKNTIYLFAKSSQNVLTPELFGMEIGEHFLRTYDHIDVAEIEITKLKWSRIPVKGVPHKHSFVRDGEEKRFTSIAMSKDSASLISTKINSGLKDLLVLKTTESSFENFLRDEYTTLPEVSDRIFSTSVDCTYQMTLPSIPVGIDFNKIFNSVLETTLEIFSTHNSASVQATLYIMATKILNDEAHVSDVTYRLPNKHYFAVDMSYKGIDNLKPADAAVFMPVDAPSGLIEATVSRKV